MALGFSRTQDRNNERKKDPYLKLLSCGKSYHVYFIYHDTACTWVKNTAERLEMLCYICFYRERDFVPGRTKTNNITTYLEKSIKFLAVVTEAFLLSAHCQYELDLALDECMNRKDEITDLIPIIIEDCELPRKLKIISSLDISLHKDTWWCKLLQILDEEHSLTVVKQDHSHNYLEQLAEEFHRKLKSANFEDIISFLCRKVAMELSHFLSQHGDLRMFVSAMETCCISFNGDVVNVRLSIFKSHLQQEHYVAQCFSEHVHKLNEKVTKVCLLLKEEEDIVDRQSKKVMTQFTKFVKSVLKTPEHEFWGIMWKMKGIQMTRRLRDECRGMIHDAVNEQEINEIARPDMSSLEARLDTFKNWPEEKSPKPIQIAEAGYYLEGPNDVFRCFYCNGVTWDLKPYEDPWQRHAKWLFYCPYIKKHRGEKFIDMCRFAKKDEREVYNPLFSSLDTRINSYKGWDCEKGPNPRSMAKAGFYFTKFEDEVVCFACGYGVRNWQYSDDPWYKHAWWSPFCKYVRRNKGQRFIDSVQEDRAKTEPSDYCLLTYSITIRDTK